MHQGNISVKELSAATGIKVDDVILTLQHLAAGPVPQRAARPLRSARGHPVVRRVELRLQPCRQHA